MATRRRNKVQSFGYLRIKYQSKFTNRSNKEHWSYLMNLYKRYTQVGPPFVPPICRHLKVPSRWGLVTDYLNVSFLPNFGILCKYLVKTKNKLLSYFCFDLRQCLSRKETFSNHQTPSRRTMAYNFYSIPNLRVPFSRFITPREVSIYANIESGRKLHN